MDNVKRPVGGETEEDLMQFQREFFSSQMQPAATVVRKPDKRKSTSKHDAESELPPDQRDVVTMEGLPGDSEPGTSSAPPVKKSRFKQSRANKDRVQLDDPEEMLEKHDRHITKILSEIVERDNPSTPVCYPNMPATSGFPAVLHRGEVQMQEGTAQKKSLFAQQFAKSTKADFGIKVTKSEQMTQIASQSSAEDSNTSVANNISKVVSGEGLNLDPGSASAESRRIHEENVAKLQSMSKNEILEQQNKLLEMLDPSLVSFFKSKKNQSGSLNHGNQVAASTSMETSEDHIAKGQHTKTIAEEDLPVKPSKDWVNMDKVEADKLAWMGNVPPAKANNLKGQQARFDFSGKNVPADENVPVHLGLHHHGDEPQRAGYSLEELFQLVRSANMQQRTIALQTLSKIISNARQGAYHEVLRTPITPALLDAGILFLLRWALDDTTDNSLAAAVQCLHSLLVCESDEVCADRVFHWYQGYLLPRLQPPAANTEAEDEEEKPHLVDADVASQDVIKGLVRMTLLPRLRYLLDAWSPPAVTVIQILEIITRVARHSPEMANEVVKCPHLIETIKEEFLTTSWTPVEEEKPLPIIHGYPVPTALKLMRALCSAGKNMAAILISTHGLMDIITRYVAVVPSDLQLHLHEAYHLNIEAFRTWHICTLYGLGVDKFMDLYPALMKMLQTSSSLNHLTNPVQIHQCCAQIGLLEAITNVAASAPLIQQHNQTASQRGQGDNMAARQSLPLPGVSWSQVHGLLQPVQLCLQTCLNEFKEKYTIKKYDLSLATCCLDYLATYFSKINSQPGYDAVRTLDHIEKVVEECIVPTVQSLSFRQVLRGLVVYSLGSIETLSIRSEVKQSLPELGALMDNSGQECPVVKRNSPFPFVLSMLRLLLTLGKLHKSILEKVYGEILEDGDVLNYLRHLCQIKRHAPPTSWFVKFENLVLYQLVKMASLKSPCDTKLYHQSALCLLMRLHAGNEHLAHDLLSTVLFNVDFLRDLEMDASEPMLLDELVLTERAPLSGGSQQSSHTARVQLIKEVLTHLASIRSTYLTAVSHLASNLSLSRAQCLCIPHETDSSVEGVVGEVLVPVDWLYVPLVQLYNSRRHRNQGNDEESLPASVVSMVTSTLQWVYLLECGRPGVVDVVSMATKISRLMCTFLAGSDLFLDNGVHSFLAALLKEYCKPTLLASVNFQENIPGLTSFYDFYNEFLSQYEAVSFGDSLFGCFLLFPMQQQHNIKLRRDVWSEHTTVLRTLLLPLQELIIPLARFLEPEETDVELLRLYFQALLSESVRPSWSPVLYLIGVHHVNRFVYGQVPKHCKLRQAMLKQASVCKNEVLQKHIVYYKKANPECKHGLELYTYLPTNRQKMLDFVKSI